MKSCRVEQIHDSSRVYDIIRKWWVDFNRHTWIYDSSFPSCCPWIKRMYYKWESFWGAYYYTQGHTYTTFPQIIISLLFLRQTAIYILQHSTTKTQRVRVQLNPDVLSGFFLQIQMQISTAKTFLFPSVFSAVKVTLRDNPQLVEHHHNYYRLCKSCGLCLTVLFTLPHNNIW